MKNLPLLISTCLTVMSAVAFSETGINGGGGTGVLTHPNRPIVLLDLFLKEPSISETRTYPSVKLRNSEDVPVCISENVSATSLPVYGVVMQKLNAWKKTGNVLIPPLQHAIDNIQFRLTDKRLLLSDRDLPYAPNEGSLVPVVRHDRTIGAITSIQSLNQLGDISFEALLIHEGLRHLQQAYLESITDQFILDFTYAIVRKSPTYSNIEHILPSSVKQLDTIKGLLDSLIEKQTTFCSSSREFAISYSESYYDQVKMICTYNFGNWSMAKEVISNYIKDLETLEDVSVGKDQIDALDLLDFARSLRMAKNIEQMSGQRAYVYNDLVNGLFNSVSSVVRENYQDKKEERKAKIEAFCQSATTGMISK